MARGSFWLLRIYHEHAFMIVFCIISVLLLLIYYLWILLYFDCWWMKFANYKKNYIKVADHFLYGLVYIPWYTVLEVHCHLYRYLLLSEYWYIRCCWACTLMIFAVAVARCWRLLLLFTIVRCYVFWCRVGWMEFYVEVLSTEVILIMLRSWCPRHKRLQGTLEKIALLTSIRVIRIKWVLDR